MKPYVINLDFKKELANPMVKFTLGDKCSIEIHVFDEGEEIEVDNATISINGFATKPIDVSTMIYTFGDEIEKAGFYRCNVQVYKDGRNTTCEFSVQVLPDKSVAESEVTRTPTVVEDIYMKIDNNRNNIVVLQEEFEETKLTEEDKTKLNNLPLNIIAELESKVDKVAGKGLSTNDYTDADKQNVEKIPAIEQDIEDLDEKFELRNWELRNRTRKPRPIVTFIDDDGRPEVWTRLKPIADQYNIPMCIAMVTNRIDKPDGLSVEQLRALVDSGWEILSHTHTHRNLTTLSYEEQEYELRTSKEILTSLGFDVQSVAYPNGARNDDTIEIARKYYRFGRATDDGRSMPNLSPLMTYDAVVTPLGSYFAWGETPFPSNSLEYYKYMVDKTVETGGWLIFMTHSWYTSVHDETQQQYLRDVIEYIQSLEVEVPIMTVRDALNERANIVDIGRYWIGDITKEHFVIGCDGKSSGNWLQSSYKILPANTYTLSNQPGDFPFGTIVNVITSSTDAPESSPGILTTAMVSPFGTYSYGYVRQEYRLSERNTTYVRYSLDSVSWSDWQLLNPVVVYPVNSRNFNSSIKAFQSGGISYVRMTLNEEGSPLRYGGGLLITNRTARYEPLQYQEFIGENNPDRVFRRHWTGSGWGNWLRITPVALTTAQRNSSNFQRNIGDQVFDTTLGKPVWWDGTKWVLADGSEA